MKEASLARQIFVVGMNGSGTTMLLDHLSSHPLIYGFPAETKSLPYLIRNEKKYGDLEVDDNMVRLWNDLTRLLDVRSQRLPRNLKPPRSQRSVAGVFDYIMCALAEAEGRHAWCEKTPMHVHHIDLLSHAFPEARFIHVIRDGRDCAASFHRRWRFNPRRTIFRWKQAVRAGIGSGSAIPRKYCEVRYEAITQAPGETMERLLSFLGMPFDAAVLSSARARPDIQASQAQQVVRNSRTAQEYFSRGTLEALEEIAGKTLSELGYVADNVQGDRDPTELQLQAWRLGDDFRRFGAVVTRGGRIMRPSKWPLIADRLKNALKQRKASSR